LGGLKLLNTRVVKCHGQAVYVPDVSAFSNFVRLHPPTRQQAVDSAGQNGEVRVTSSLSRFGKDFLNQRFEEGITTQRIEKRFDVDECDL
jgi:hypothetical protein